MKKNIILLAVFIALTSFAERKRTTWVAIGDSITYLNDHLNETGDRVTKGYMTLVTERLTDVEYINKGYNGWTAVGIAKEIEKLGIQKADVYSVFLGTNDWWAGLPVGTLNDYTNATGNETVYGAFRTIVNKLRSLNKDAKVILITPMQRGDFVYIGGKSNNAWGSYKDKNGQSLEQFALAVKNIAKYEKFELVDLYHTAVLHLKHAVKYKRIKENGTYQNLGYPQYVGKSFDAKNDEYPYPLDAVDMTYDGLHPSDKGYEVIAAKLIRVMKKLTVN